MQPIPNDILAQFDALMIKKEVPFSARPDYRKWLRYYFDFRSRYQLPDSKSEHVRLFIEKLQQKNQSPAQQKQAAHALSLFFCMGAETIPEAQYRATTEGLPLQGEYDTSDQYRATNSRSGGAATEGLP